METVVDNNNSSESSFCRDEKVEAMDLLEECWFFENLLNIRPMMMMPRSYSDPYPSSSSSSTALINTDFLVKDNDILSNSSSSSSSSSSSARGNNKPPRNGSSSSHTKKIQRAPSMPQFKVKEEGDNDDDKQGGNKLMMKGNHRNEGNRRKNKLVRTPSLPLSMGSNEKFQENDPRIGRSDKQTSTPKSCSIPRYRASKNIEGDSINKGEGIKEMRPKYLNQRRMMRRSLSDLELEEVQGFKDLGFSFEKERLSPSLVSIIPGLQDKNRDETEEDKKARGPYLSEAWLVKSPPPIPNCDSKKSAADMKKHIKFWAKAVASNVHQEC
ncbi:uncharacterized protein LOC130946428 [Arachis stenosperma]|uniref:uncharacterized protein LOC130946428 n=1 Tax=Arachis stenosperma TaxID=217475 RepID=UPI0025ACC44C|nr:uncharacterized protein LOC130946428 [Arachis stenosperma]